MSEISNFRRFKKFSLINKKIFNTLIKLSNKNTKGKSYLLLHNNKKKITRNINLPEKGIFN